MKALAVAVLVLGASALAAQDRPAFAVYDVVLDSESRVLGAWQVEVKGLEVVGLEGGDTAAWREAPYYDPAALAGGRLLVAGFTLDASAPAGRVRVASIHAIARPGADATVTLVAAAESGGARFVPKATLVRRGGAK